MIILEPRNLEWLKNIEDERIDLCAHGNVFFSINGEVLVSETDGYWTVSAAALYLLRALEKDHTREKPLFEHVFPCCGFNMYDDEKSENVAIWGCPNGIDFKIRHQGENTIIKYFSFEPFIVSKTEWNQAVLHFSQTVMDFYASSKPKIPHDEEKKRGFEKFMSEWRRRRDAAKNF